jgi:ABC-type branched-subunit amino acid transport system substrate-binding protein
VANRYFIELVALNDFNEPDEAIIQARKMAVDGDVMGVLGGWSPETASSAGAEYERLGVPFLAPPGGEIPPATSPSVSAAFVEAYQSLSGGVPPGQPAVWAYRAADRLLDAMEDAVRVEAPPTRTQVHFQLLDQQPK